MSLVALDLGARTLSGISSMGQTRDLRQKRRDLEERARLIGGFLSPLKEEYMAGLAPGGFIRAALSSGGYEEAAKEAELLESQGRLHSSRESAVGVRNKNISDSAEALGRASSTLGAALKSDDLLARQMFTTLGYYTDPKSFDDIGFAAGILRGVTDSLEKEQRGR